MSDRLKEIRDGYTNYTWVKMKLAVADLLKMVGSANLAAEIFQADCEKKDRRISKLEAKLDAVQWQPIETAPKDGKLIILL